MTDLQFRVAGPADAAAVAALHADSWRRHYRGAYADAYLDGDVVSDRMAVWQDRLDRTDGTHTLLASRGNTLVGFVHTMLGKDPVWGALLDNLHVADGHKRLGIGARLVRKTAGYVADHAPGSGLYLWVLEQNESAQSFYTALGGVCVERDVVPAPGGVAGRLNGSPGCLRFSWPDSRTLSIT